MAQAMAATMAISTAQRPRMGSHGDVYGRFEAGKVQGVLLAEHVGNAVLGHQIVHHSHQNQGDNGDLPRGQLLPGIQRRRLLEKLHAAAVGFSRGGGLFLQTHEIGHAQREDEQTADYAEKRRGIGVGIEEGCGNDVLDLGGAGETVHGEGDAAQPDGPGNQPFGNDGQLEHFRKELIRHSIGSYSFESLPTASPVYREAKIMAQRFAPNDLPILPQGETGVGKPENAPPE